MRIAIVGSREFPDMKMVEAFVDALPLDTEIVSGHCRGVDMVAEKRALARGLTVDSKPAKWDDCSHPDAVVRTNKWGKPYDASAGFRRNKEVVHDSQVIVAFWDGTSRGTLDTIQYANKFNKPTHVILPSGDWHSVIDSIKKL